MKRSFAVGVYIGVLLVLSQIGQAFGGVYWIPFFIAFIPAVAVGAGFVYGRLTGAGSGVDSDASVWDTAVSKGLEARRDTEPEDESNE